MQCLQCSVIERFVGFLAFKSKMVDLQGQLVGNNDITSTRIDVIILCYEP